MAKKQSSMLVPGLLIAVIVIGALFVLGGDKGDTTTATVTDPTTGKKVPATAVAPATINSGELELFLKDSNGATGVSSTVLLLDPKVHAKYTADGKFDAKKTRYDIMNIHFNKGLDGLTGVMGGTAKAISVASGEWSEAQLNAKKGDKVLVFTYVDTAPSSVENATSVGLLTLVDFYRETGKWVAQGEDGKVAWNLVSYGDYDWFDGTDVEKQGYYHYPATDSTAETDVTVTWYSRSNAKGEACIDCGIYLQAQSSYTGKFGSLTVTDKFGHSKKFTSLQKAENFAGDDPRGIAATILAAARTSNDWYYVGQIPDDFVTLYTTGDKNRLTWELETDTYTTNRTINITIVQNANAPTSNNGAFEVTDDFQIMLANCAGCSANSSGFAAGTQTSGLGFTADV